MRVAEFGIAGVTDNELIKSFDGVLPGNTPRARRIELSDDGLIEDTAAKREGSTVRTLTSRAQKALLPVLTAAQCATIKQVHGSSLAGLDPLARNSLETSRIGLARLIRQGQRAAVGTGLELDEDVSPLSDATGAVPDGLHGALSPQASWAGSTRIDAELSGAGLRLGLQFEAPGLALDGQEAHRRARLRTALTSSPSADLPGLAELVDEGWELVVRSDTGAVVFPDLATWAAGFEDAAVVAVEKRWTPAELQTLGYSIGSEAQRLSGAAAPLIQALVTGTTDAVETLAETLYWDRDRAAALIALTQRTRQLLFAGPPGTGKTYAARALARALSPYGTVRTIQFHPTYAYEDFVEGIRPVLTHFNSTPAPAPAGISGVSAPPVATGPPPGGLGYELRRGVLREIATEATQNGDQPVYLIIDEVNRANLPRVLGELLYSLEYRGPGNEVTLPYSGEQFYLPDNLWIIGTMNTADRSITAIDAAMRRRFKHVGFSADYDALRAWHSDRTSIAVGVEAAERLARLNAVVVDLLDADRTIGHSFLMSQDLPVVGFEAVWDEDIEPVLRDHLMGQSEGMEDLRSAFLDPVNTP